MPESHFWLVELYEDLEHLPVTVSTSPTTRIGVWHAVHGVNGIKAITDMSAISFDTLQELLLPSDPALVQRWRREKARALRAKRRTAAA